MLKKILIVFGAFIGLIILAIIIVPMVFDANKFKPQIEKLVEEKMNADLELGNLKLSLWGGVHVDVSKVVLSEKGSHGTKPVFKVNDAKLELPLSSIVSGRPDITFSMTGPQITIISETDGKMNVSKLTKPQTPEEIVANKKKAQDQSGKKGGLNLPFELSFHVEKGLFTFADQRKNTRTEIKGFEFDLKHLTLNQPFHFSFKSNLDVKEMKELTFHGPLAIEGDAGIYMGPAGELDHLDLETNVDLSSAVLRYADLLNKTDKNPLIINVKLTTNGKDLKIDKGHLQIADAAVDLTGTVKNFDAPVVNMQIVSSKFIFDHWQAVLAPLRQFDMKGAASFDIKIEGPTSKIAFNGRANVLDMSLKAPGIVPRVTNVNATLAFSNDKAMISKTSLKMGNSDLALEGTVRNFSAPVINVSLKSQLLDIDALLPQKTPEQEKADAQAAARQAKNGDPAQAEAEMEKSVQGPITAMKSNPMVRALDFTAKAQIGKIRVHKADISNLNAEMTFKNLVLALRKASAQAFNGAMNFNSNIDFRGADPAYSVGAEASGVDINSAITSQMPTIKDNVFGKAFAKMTVTGTGIAKAKVKQALKGNGNFKIEGGSWSALKVLQTLGEKLKSLPAGIGEKLGGVNISGKFRSLKADFNIASGRFNIVNMIADMEEANTGVTGAGYVDFDMNTNLLGRILVPASGDIAQGDLRSADGRLSIPYEVGCQIMSPCPKWDNTLKVVGTSLAKNQGKAALKKVLEDNINNPQVKDLLKKLPF